MHTLKNIVLPNLNELDAKDIKTGLDAVSKYLNTPPGQPMPIVVAGGACSVMMLKSRKTTKDIDWITATHDLLGVVGEASREADKKETKRFPRAWMSSDLMAIADYMGNQNIFADSVAQGEIMYQSASLIVYAADWRFQLVNKLVRIGDEDAKEKDISDAVAFTRRLVQRRGQVIKKTEIATWYFFGPSVEDVAIDIVNAAYQKMYSDNAEPLDKFH